MFNLFKKNDNTTPAAIPPIIPPIAEPELPTATPPLSWAQRLKNGLAKTGAKSTKALRPARRKIEWVGAAFDLVKDVEKAIADTQIESDSCRDVEFVLKVAKILSLAKAVDRERTVEAGRADLVGVKGCERRKYDRSGLSISLVELNAPDFGAGLDRMPATHPCKVVDLRK